MSKTDKIPFLVHHKMGWTWGYDRRQLVKLERHRRK